MTQKLVPVMPTQTIMVGGVPRSPIEGVQYVTEDEANRYVAAKMAEYADDVVDLGSEDDDGDRGGAFDADTFIARKLDEISDDEIGALTPDQVAAVRKAEEDREQPRKGLLERLPEA